MKKAQYSLFYIKILFFAYFYSISCSADEFLDSLNRLYEEAQVQENFYAAMGKMNFDYYNNPLLSKGLRCADQICYNHQSEILWRSIREYLAAFIILYEKLLSVTGLSYHTVKAVQDTLTYLLNQLGSAIETANQDVDEAQQNHPEDLVGSAEFFCNLSQFNAEYEALGNFYIEGCRHHNTLKKNELSLNSLRETIPLHQLAKNEDWAKNLINWGASFLGPMLPHRQPPYFETYEPGLPFSKLRFSPAVVHTVLNQFRSESLKNLMGIPKLIIALQSTKSIKKGAKKRSPETTVLPREIVDLIEDFWFKINIKQKLDGALSQFDDVDREILRLALGSKTNNNSKTLKFDDLEKLIEKLGGKRISTPFGSRFIIPNILRKGMTHKNSQSYFEFKMPSDGLLSGIKAILGPVLQISGWGDALLTTPYGGNFTDLNWDILIRKSRLLALSNSIDVKSFINIPEKSVLISPQVVSQKLFWEVLKNYPLNNSIPNVDNPPEEDSKDTDKLLADFPVNNVALLSTEQGNSIEEFLEAINSIFSEIGIKDVYFRLPTPSEYEMASALSELELKHKSDYVAIGRHNCRPHAVGAMKPNEKGFYSGGVLEWLSSDLDLNSAKLYGRSYKTLGRTSIGKKPHPYNTSYKADDVGFRIVLVRSQEISYLLKK